MTKEERYQITFPEFVSLFYLGDADMDYPKLHDGGVLEIKDMHFMYPKNMRGSWGKVRGLYTYYGVLNRLFRKTLTPRDGNPSDVTLSEELDGSHETWSTSVQCWGFYLARNQANLIESPEDLQL
jgi:hypothetical protein